MYIMNTEILNKVKREMDTDFDLFWAKFSNEFPHHLTAMAASCEGGEDDVRSVLRFAFIEGGECRLRIAIKEITGEI